MKTKKEKTAGQAISSKNIVPKKLPRWAKGVAVYFSSIIAILVILFGSYSVVFAGQIYPRVAIANIAVGGLKPEAAKQRLETELAHRTIQPLVLTTDSGKSFTLKPDEIGVQFSVDDSVAAAMAVGRGKRFLVNLTQKITSPIFGIDLPASVHLDDQKLTDSLKKIVDEVSVKEKNADLAIKDGVVTITPASIGKVVDAAALKEEVIAAFGRNQTEPIGLVAKEKDPEIKENELEDAKKQAEIIIAEPIRFTADHQEFTASPNQIGDWLETKIVKGLLKSKAELQVNEAKIDKYIASLAEKIDQEPINAKLAVVGGNVTIIETSKDGRKVKRDTAKTDLLRLLMIRKEVPEASLGTSTPENSPSANLTDSPAVSPNPSATAEISTNQIVLEVEIKKPDVTNDNISDLGIKERVAVAVTDFKGSPNNRQENIRLGTRLFNGIILKPGDTFSAVKSLGRIDESAGFKPELVIKEDALVPEVGGGLCQVSTTLFRAAMNAGLDITERKNHRFRVSYYESRPSNPDPEDYVTLAAKSLVGMDATIYDPSPDFKFKNNTDHYLLIQGRVEGTRLTFELFGTKEGRKVTIDGPYITSTTPAPTEIQYIDNPSLPAGTTKLKEKAAAGAKTYFKYKVEKDGKVMQDKTFSSSYSTWQAKYYRGTGPAAAPSPTADPNATPIPAPSPTAAPTEAPSPAAAPATEPTSVPTPAP